MSSYAVENSPPSDSRSADDQHTARHLLRSQRCKLISGLSAETAKALADKLFELYIISDDEMEDIQSQRTRREMVRRLLSVMNTRSWLQCLRFARLLTQTEGIEEIGTKLLEEAGEAMFSVRN